MQIPSNAQGGADVAVLEEIDEKQQHCSELKQCYQIGLGLRVFFCEGVFCQGVWKSPQAAWPRFPSAVTFFVCKVCRGGEAAPQRLCGAKPCREQQHQDLHSCPQPRPPLPLPGTPAATFTAPESDTGKISFHSRLRLHHRTHTHRIWGTLRTGAEMKGQP